MIDPKKEAEDIVKMAESAVWVGTRSSLRMAIEAALRKAIQEVYEDAATTAMLLHDDCSPDCTVEPMRKLFSDAICTRMKERLER